MKILLFCSFITCITSYYFSSLHSEYNFLTQSIQSNIINAQIFNPLNITTIWHEKQKSFLYSKPNFNEKNIQIQAFLKEEKYNKYPMLWLKMKSQGAYVKEFGKLKCGLPATARKINKEIMDKQLQSHLHTQLQIKYEEDALFGKKKTSGFEWFAHPLICEYDDLSECLTIKSPVLITSENLFIKKYAGNHYMKLLTPAYADYLIETYGKKDV